MHGHVNMKKNENFNKENTFAALFEQPNELVTAIKGNDSN